MAMKRENWTKIQISCLLSHEIPMSFVNSVSPKKKKGIKSLILDLEKFSLLFFHLKERVR